MRFPLLFDDAAIFPPGNLPLDEAIRAHHAHREAPYARLVGPLVVSLPDLSKLAGTGPLDIAVVVPDAASAAVAMDWASAISGVRLVSLEVAATTVERLRWEIGEPAGTTVYVELPRDERRPVLIEELAGTAYRAKLRTGGARADLYPDELELATAVVALVAAGLPFKATAGLHHALRNTDRKTGFEQHGFLNLLAATGAAAGGASVDEVASVLAERSANRVHLPDGDSLLRSIGTCSIDEPLAELTELGLLDLVEAR